jgi:two-component system, response regulator YesN
MQYKDFGVKTLINTSMFCSIQSILVCRRRKFKMKFKMKFKKNSVLRYYIISYICVVIIPISICLIIYDKSINVIKQEINNNNLLNLKQVQNSMDNRLLELQNIAVQINLNPTVKRLINNQQNFSEQDRYLFREVTNELNSYVVANRFIKKIYIYFKDSDTALTNKNSSNSTGLFNNLHYDDKIEYSKWKDKISSLNFNTYLPIEKNNNEQYFFYIQSLPMEPFKESFANLVILVDESSFSSIVESLNLIKDSSFAIIDDKNDLLFFTKEKKLDFNLKELKTLNFDKSNKIFYDTSNIKFAISYIKSKNFNWQYISITPYSIFSERVSYIRNITIGIMLISLIIVIYLIYFFTKKNYAPIQKIASKLGQNYFNVNEFKYIEEMLEKTMKENYEVKSQLYEQVDIIRDNFLARLIQGNVNIQNDFDKYCRLYNIDFTDESYVLIAFHVEDWERIKNIDSNNESLSDMVRFILKDEVSEVFNIKGQTSIFEIEKRIILLYKFKQIDYDDVKNMISNGLSIVKATVKSYYNISLSVAVSRIYNEITLIKNAYREVVKTIDYRVVEGKENILYHDDIALKYKNNTEINYSLKHVEQITNCIYTGEYREAQDIINEFFEIYLTGKNTSIDFLKYNMISTINIIVNALNDIRNKFKKDFFCKLNPVDRLLKCETIRELQVEINSILLSLDEYTNDMKITKNDELKDGIIRYVKENYYKNSISVASIADEFAISVVNISKLFKKAAGVGLLDYIHKLRIEEAKKLIVLDVYSVKDIAEKIGYINSDAFIRVFKKHEGVTPGKYKEIYHRE